METVAVTVSETNCVPIEKSDSDVLNSNNLTSNAENVASKADSTSEVKKSKNQMKREAKNAKRLENKAERRAIEREKNKIKRAKRRLEDPSIDSLHSLRKKLKDSTMANSNCHVGLVIDLSFDDLMDEKSMASCVKQILRCYSINRRAANPVQFYVTGLSGKSLTEMSKHNGYMNWDVNFHKEQFLDVLDKEKVVYLTSDSENIIENFDDGKFYVIGGLVDHNHNKGLCHKQAVERGLNHGRLPIDEYICLKTRKVLTIDHVFNIAVNVCNGQSWKDAFMSILPTRKGATELSSEVEVPEISSDIETSESIPLE